MRPPSPRTASALMAAAAATLALGAVPARAQAEAPSKGQALFARNCSACHQLTGKGIPGAFPALDGDPIVQGPPQPLATLLIHGRGGMPSFRNDLDDAEIGAVLTYVRSAWSNHAGPVDPTAAAAARGSGAPAPPPTRQAH